MSDFNSKLLHDGEQGMSAAGEKGMSEDTLANRKCEYFVYLLQCSNKRATYVGATISLDRRLRQHNKEIKGGAKITGAKVEQGYSWKRVCHVAGFPTWQAALQFEWRWKQLTRKQPPNKDTLIRRRGALAVLLALPSSTSKAVPYSNWPSQPVVFDG